MLSRTADNLFWLARYTERADSTGRLLVFGRRLAMLPDGISGDDWRSVLRVAGCEGYVEPHVEVTEADAVAVLLLDPDNPSSIRASLDRARWNGRAVRTALTLEMWEALNDGWRRLERLTTDRAVRDLPTLIDWVRGYVARFRGAVSTSMLRNEGYDFLRIGGGERARGADPAGCSTSIIICCCPRVRDLVSTVTCSAGVRCSTPCRACAPTIISTATM